MKLSWRTELPQLAAIGCMFLIAVCSWTQAPDRIPVHWNLQGEIDGYGNKFIGLLLLPLITLGMYCLLRLAYLVDPGKANYANFAPAFTAVRTVIVLFLATLYGATVLAAFGRQTDMTTIVCC